MCRKTANSQRQRTRVNHRRWGPPLAHAALALVMLIGCSQQPPDAASTTADGAKQPDTGPAAPIDSSYPVVRIQTSAGNMVVKLDAIHSAGTVHNFLSYVSEGFYAGTLFHYVEPGEMILGGGYTADGQLKPTRPPIRNEAHNGLENGRGTIAMARDAAVIDSATSQFFINLVDAPHFDHEGDTAEKYGYCVFGEVIEGLDVARRISELPTKDLGGDLVKTPRDPVVIESIRVIR